jgi:hypothetical protein
MFLATLQTSAGMRRVIVNASNESEMREILLSHSKFQYAKIVESERILTNSSIHVIG